MILDEGRQVQGSIMNTEKLLLTSLLSDEAVMEAQPYMCDHTVSLLEIVNCPTALILIKKATNGQYFLGDQWPTGAR